MSDLHLSPSSGRPRRHLIVCATATFTITALALGAPSEVTHAKGASRTAAGTRIVIRALSNRGRAPTQLLGVNHSYSANGFHLWNPTTDAPRPAVVKGARRARIRAMRFPGGSVANLYDWKRAIGPRHRCQVDGRVHHGRRGKAVTRGLAFGPDEYMRFLHLIGARPLIMVPFVTETPADAADWVEYMNAPAGRKGNPHGGTDWADVRAANGHPRPYGVHWWEIGNEQQHAQSRFWMARNAGRRLRQYAFGGSAHIKRELLGRRCAHPARGIRSNGKASQTFEMLYPPVAPRSVRIVIGRHVWRRVPHLSGARPRARVYRLRAKAGRVVFGDGKHGAIPRRGRKVRASYRSVHQGFFAFAREMKQVDPSIKVCSTWGLPAFPRLVGHRRYDCVGAHANTGFSSAHGRPHWSGPLEGHDQFMLHSQSVLARVRELRRSLPRSHPLLLTEFTVLHGDSRAFPAWATSESHAVYMASLWADWLMMRISEGNGDSFLFGNRGVLGRPPRYTFSADAVTRRALSPMFSAGGVLLRERIIGNPVRHPPGVSRSYPGLTVAATRAHRVVRLLVVNRLPEQRVGARIVLQGRRARRSATFRYVTGTSFSSWNRSRFPPSVVLHVRSRTIGASGFDHTFPPASTTVIDIHLR